MKLYYANSTKAHADVIVLGIPYDRTSSFIPGSRFGPQFIRQCSENIEDYSPYQNKTLCDLKICDMDDIQFYGDNWLQQIEKEVSNIHDGRRSPVFLGGEHTITAPIIRAIHKKAGAFTIVQFDAHCDLRDEYLGEKDCHATAMRRVIDVLGADRVFQFGIRSGTKEEFASGKNLFKYKAFEPLSKVIDRIKDPIYITIDVDVCDPGVLPAVSTPEPGGISYRELIDSLILFKGKRVIAGDIVEYNPLAAPPYASGSTVAEVLRELILVMAHQG
ncbi:MAG: agmatinase [candidate division WOR-3 bacterium]|nr:MAG: agmatinase [candidate division WOR-3 bacterium]